MLYRYDAIVSPESVFRNMRPYLSTWQQQRTYPFGFAPELLTHPFGCLACGFAFLRPPKSMERQRGPIVELSYKDDFGLYVSFDFWLAVVASYRPLVRGQNLLNMEIANIGTTIPLIFSRQNHRLSGPTSNPKKPYTRNPKPYTPKP